MISFRVLPQAKSRNIEVPAAVAHRSRAGSTLILRSGTSHEVTDEEWEHIKSVDDLEGIVQLGSSERAKLAALQSADPEDTLSDD